MVFGFIKGRHQSGRSAVHREDASLEWSHGVILQEYRLRFDSTSPNASTDCGVIVRQWSVAMEPRGGRNSVEKSKTLRKGRGKEAGPALNPRRDPRLSFPLTSTERARQEPNLSH